MEKISLKEIANALGLACDTECMIEAISTDTRNIEKGSLFVAIEGERFDGHTFAAKAEALGAAALVCHKKVNVGIPVLYVNNTREAYLDIAGYYRSRFDIPLIGITGSVGKTTTKEFVALALSAKYRTLKTQGNFNNDIGMPKTLLELDNRYQAAVIEMGMNHFGEIRNLVMRSRPTMGIITNIGVSHIENLGSREGILKAKLELVEGLQDSAPLLLNADDDQLVKVSFPDRPVYFFGIQNEAADYRAVHISTQTSGSSFDIVYKGGMQHVSIPAPGEHNIRNALCAFAAGVLNGIEAEAIAAKLAEYRPAGMRQNIRECGTFIVIEDCYNASPDSMRAALQMLGMMDGKKKIAVLADMLELGEYAPSFHKQVGAYAAASGTDVLLAYGTNAKYYCEAAENGVLKAQWFESKDALLQALLKEIEANSVILFKGSHGMHLEQTIHELYERKGIEHE